MARRARSSIRAAAAALSFAAASWSPVAPGPVRVAAAQQAPACTLRGTAVAPKGVLVYTAATAGEPIARFTGQPVALALGITANGRAQLRTGTGSGGFRIEGFVEPRELPAYTTKNVPVVPAHVSIGGGRRVRLGSAAGTSVAIEMHAGMPIDQVVRATAACDALSIELPSFRQPAVPGDARGYLVKKVPLDLRGEPDGPVIFSFTSPSAKDALLFWSTERSGGNVRVLLTGDLVVDAWAKASDLEALKSGEMMDAIPPGVATISQPKLILQGTPSTVRATREVPIRAHANDASATIGAVEPGGEVLVIETVLGWSNVLPTTLHVMPPDGRGFWVKTSELPTPVPAPSPRVQ